MTDLDRRVTGLLEEIVTTTPEDPPYPLGPFRYRKESPVSRVNVLVAAGAAAVIAAVLLIPGWGDIATPGRIAAPTTAPSAPVVSESPPPSGAFPDHVVVVTSGELAEWYLESGEHAFSTATGVTVDVQVLDTESDALRRLDQDRKIDVIETGFRPELLSGAMADVFVPLDPGSVPGLARVHDPLRLPGDFGVVPGVVGLLGLIADPNRVSVDSWEGLAGAAAGHEIAIPGPPSPLATLLALELGGGDVEAGLSAYRGLVDAGAVLMLNNNHFLEAVEGGAEVLVWTTSGMEHAMPFGYDHTFVAPAGGAPILPAFSGILAGSEVVEGAMVWLDHRLSPEVQDRMAVSEGPSGAPEIIGWGPSVRDMGYPAGLDFVDLDRVVDAAKAVDWAAFAAAQESLDAGLLEIVGGRS